MTAVRLLPGTLGSVCARTGFTWAPESSPAARCWSDQQRTSHQRRGDSQFQPSKLDRRDGHLVAKHRTDAQDYLSALLRTERHLASSLILAAVQAGIPIRDLYLQVFQLSQREVGRLWQMNQISVAQEHYCTAATQLIMSQLYPYIFSGERRKRTLIAACVAGDPHEIGARMVSDLLEMEGWNTIYLGANVPTSSIIQLMREREVDVLALSATMTFHVPAVERVIADIRHAQEVRPAKIMVGGYPFNIAPELWRQIGADAWAPDAAQAIAVADRLLAMPAPS